jgi:monoamine oxidase
MRKTFPDELEAEIQRNTCFGRLRNISVAVVGGGLAGLIAARQLGRQGVKVKVFEARNQLGGRVLSNTQFSKGRITEEGAELIGSFHTRWLALAQGYGLTMVSRMDGSLYDKAGLNVRLALDKMLSPAEIRELDEYVGTKLKRIAQIATTISDPRQPWLQTALRVYDNMSVAKALTLLGVRRGSRPWMGLEFLLVNNEVAPLDDMNFLGLLCKVKAGQRNRNGSYTNLMGYWNELESFRSSDGCQKLATEIAKEAHERYSTEVRLNAAVTRIELSGSGVKLGVRKVILRDGTLAPGPPAVFNADYVILAVPPSVWRGVTITADGTRVRPEIEIGEMDNGAAVKFFSSFNQRFWIKNKAAPYGGSSTIGQVWEGTDNQTKLDDQGVVLSVFAGPCLKGPGGPRVPTADECKKELNRLYPGYAGNLIKTLYTDWPNMPFIKTGYVSPKIGQIFRIGDKLLKPFHGRLFFAGEHTQMDFFGYMEGALRSGERAAENLIRQVCPLEVGRVA